MIKRTQDEIIQNWHQEYNHPLVSVRCITYNHEKYIAQALESFLMQETNFPFEIVVHDDASTDKTADIIREYEAKYPKIIKPIYETENQYSKKDGSITRIMQNACNGKYVAFCEGDDYWIDSNKLQRQVDFLEHNSDYTLSSENGLILYTKTGVVQPFSKENNQDYTVEDLLIKRRFPTASVVARNKYLLDPKNLNLPWDTMKWAFLAQKGKVHFDSTISSIYRRGSGITESNKIAWAKISERINHQINVIFTPSKEVRQARNRTLFYDYENALKAAIKQHKFSKVIYFCLKMTSINPISFIKEIARISLKVKIRSLLTKFWRLYYSIAPAKKLNSKPSDIPEIVVSLTSYPARFKTLHLVLKSLLNQTFSPNKIVLYLDKCVKINSLPPKILELQSHGVLIKNICEDIKPHNKYFYAMKEYEKSIIVTADDDVMYPRNWLESLYQSYQNFPNAVSARRVHKISRNIEGNAMPYHMWEQDYKQELKPSMDLMATGIGGVLYPPCIFSQMENIFKENIIKDVCLLADDVWLKFIEKKKGVKVKWVRNRFSHPYIINDETLKNTGLMNENVNNNQNDVFISKCEKFFNFKL